MTLFCTMIALLLSGSASAAELDVHDVTGCLDADAVRSEITQRVPHPELRLQVSALPEGDDLAIEISVHAPVDWQRTLIIGPADCEAAALLIAVTVERGVAGLPGMHVAPSSVEANWGGLLVLSTGVGVVPVAPSLSGSLLFSAGARWRAVVGIRGQAGTQAVAAGQVRTISGLGVLGLAWRRDRTQLRAELHNGLLRAQGRGFATELDITRFRSALRVGADVSVSQRFSMVGGLRVPLTPVLWVLEGTGQVAEPAVRLDLGVAVNLFTRK